jgi:hypothetical protein
MSKKTGCKPGMKKVKEQCRYTIKALNQQLLKVGINNKEVVKFGRSNIDGHRFPGKYQIIHILNKNMAMVPLYYSDNISEIAGHIDKIISDRKEYVKSQLDDYSKK